jgi:hypothetical protein
MFGSYRIQETTPDELPELGRFLREGFQEPPEIAYFTEPALRWKYFEPCGVEFGPRSYVARANGRIVGHVGIVPRTFVVRGGNAPTSSHSALHFIDLLASPEAPMAGWMLIKKGFQATVVQYALGGSADWRRIAELTGFERRIEFPIYRAILRPFHRAHAAGLGPGSRLLRVGWDLAQFLSHPGQRRRRPVTLERAAAFGPEVESLMSQGPSPLVLTSRTAELLNYFLRYPAGTMSGWLVQEGPQTIGFAVLNVVADRDHRRGKIVECYLASSDDELWHAAVGALKQELEDQRADVASCYASTTWLDQACRRAGFLPQRKRQQFLLRDEGGQLPRDLPYHLTPIEADHAYL